jgi:hypothetical protein
VADNKRPDLDRLRALLRESKATSAVGQQMLDDPEGAALIVKAQQVTDEALRLGDIATATKAGDILHNLQSKEQAVRDAQAVSRQAQDEGVRVMADGLGRAE